MPFENEISQYILRALMKKRAENGAADAQSAVATAPPPMPPPQPVAPMPVEAPPPAPPPASPVTPESPDPVAPMPTPEPSPAPPATSAVAPATPNVAPINPLDPKYSPEARQQLVNQSKPGIGATIGTAFAGLGDAISNSYGTGGHSNHMGAAIENQQAQKAQQLDQFDKGRAENLQDYKTGQDVATQDPNSPRSRALQAAAAPMLLASGMKKEDIAKIPGAEIETVLKSATSYADAKARMAQIAENKKLSLENQNFNLSTRQDQFDQRDMTRLTTQLNNDKDLTNARQKINNVDTAMKNLDQMKSQPGGADQRQMVELAATTMRVLKNSGQITEQELNQLIPHTYKGDWGKFLEKLTNEPTSVDAGAFVDRFQHTLARERDQAQGQLEMGFRRTMSTHQNTLKRNPDSATDIYKQWGMNHPDYNPASSGQDKGAAAAPDHGAAIKWAQANPNDPRAKIIMQRASQGAGGQSGI